MMNDLPEHDWTFSGLNRALPYHSGKKKHVNVYKVSDNVRIKSPGKYYEVTNGGDFVVETYMSNHSGMEWRQLAHYEYIKYATERTLCPTDTFLVAWKNVLDGQPVDDYRWLEDADVILLESLLLIGICEYRRYPKSEPVGGRYLLYNFAYGIANYHWPKDVALMQLKWGKPGLNHMQSQYGTGVVIPSVQAQ